MSGIYIPGIEMPKGGAIEIMIFAEGKAIKSGYTVSIDGKDYYAPTLGETPAVQALPVPDHGRLIDADAIIQRIPIASYEIYENIRSLIDSTPTIIPAEKEERT